MAWGDFLTVMAQVVIAALVVCVLVAIVAAIRDAWRP